MTTLLHESQIFSPLECIQFYYDADVIGIEQFENYQKRSYRNRYKILTSQGIEVLSVPLKKGKNHQKPIKEVEISYDEPWNLKHLHSIRSAYGKSPFFDYYYQEVERLLLKNWAFLFDLNTATSEFILSALRLDITLVFSKEYKVVPGGGDILYWNDKKDKILPSYTQVWSDRFDFVPGLSSLDLLFCTGPEASQYLHPLQS